MQVKGHRSRRLYARRLNVHCLPVPSGRSCCPYVLPTIYRSLRAICNTGSVVLDNSSFNIHLRNRIQWGCSHFRSLVAVRSHRSSEFNSSMPVTSTLLAPIRARPTAGHLGLKLQTPRVHRATIRAPRFLLQTKAFTAFKASACLASLSHPMCINAKTPNPSINTDAAR